MESVEVVGEKDNEQAEDEGRKDNIEMAANEVEEEKENEVMGEKENTQAEEETRTENVVNAEMEVEGLDQFDTPDEHMFEASENLGFTPVGDSYGSEGHEISSGSTLAPNTLSKKPADSQSESLDLLCQEILEESNEGALKLIDELKSERESIREHLTEKIEKLEDEKNQLEVEKMKLEEDTLTEIEKLKKEKQSILKSLIWKIENLEKEVEIEKKNAITVVDELNKEKENLMEKIANLENEVEREKKNAITVADELNKEKDNIMEKIANLEKEVENDKQEMEIDGVNNERAVAYQENRIAMLNQKLEEAECKKKQDAIKEREYKALIWDKSIYISTLRTKVGVLEKQKQTQQEMIRELQAQLEEIELHQVTQGYVDETERQVHQVTQQTTVGKIKRLEEKNAQLEAELLEMQVHELTQKEKAEKSQLSPSSKVKRLKARERKDNKKDDYFYEELKKKSPKELFIDVENCQVSNQEEKEKKKLKKLKASLEISKLLPPETFSAIQSLWNTANTR